MKRRSVEQQIEDVMKKHTLYRYKLFAIETTAFQYVMADNLRKASKESSVYVPIEEIINYQDKKMRIEGIIPFIKDGTVVFDMEKKKGNNMYARGIEQLWTFTGEGDEEDDFPDCLEMAFRIAKAPSYKMITKPTRR